MGGCASTLEMNHDARKGGRTMAIRTPTPELIDSMHHDLEPHHVPPRHVRKRMPTWGWAIVWVGAAAVVALVWRIVD
jgi:hypothetical protein